MWFNGTEISNKAQRAIRNEQVTIVAHPTAISTASIPTPPSTEASMTSSAKCFAAISRPS
jgi:hypothetical protein